MYSIQEYLDDTEQRLVRARTVIAKYKDARFAELPDGREVLVSDMCCADVVSVELAVSKADVRLPLTRTVYAVAYATVPFVHQSQACVAMVYVPRDKWKSLYGGDITELVGDLLALEVARGLAGSTK